MDGWIDRWVETHRLKKTPALSSSLLLSPSRASLLFDCLSATNTDSPVEPPGAAGGGVPREGRSGLGARPSDVEPAQADRLRQEVGAGAGAEDEGDVGEGRRRGHRSVFWRAKGGGADKESGEREREWGGKNQRKARSLFSFSRYLLLLFSKTKKVKFSKLRGAAMSAISSITVAIPKSCWRVFEGLSFPAATLLHVTLPSSFLWPLGDPRLIIWSR